MKLPAPLLGVLLLGLVLAGCGADDDPASPRGRSSSPGATAHWHELTAGTCWSDEQLPQALGERGFRQWVAKYADGDAELGAAMRDDAAFSERADCAKPHALELYAVVSLPRKLERRIDSYAELLDDSSALFRSVRDEVNDRCAAGSPYGKAMRKAGLPVQLGPALAKDSGLHLAWDPFPADLWGDGEHKFVCTFEQEEPGTLRYDDLAGPKLPLEARVCLNTPAKFVPCRGPHQAEDIGEMILNTAIDAGDIDAKKAVRTEGKRKYVALSKDEYDRLDKVCQNLLGLVSTRTNELTARAYPGSVDQWPTDEGTYVATCFALRPLDPPPKFRGTVFDRR